MSQSGSSPPTMIPLLNHQVAMENERLRVSGMYNGQLIQMRAQIQALTAALTESRRQLEELKNEKEKEVSELQSELSDCKKRIKEKEDLLVKERKEWKKEEKAHLAAAKKEEKANLAAAKKEWLKKKREAVAAAKEKTKEKTVKRAAKTLTKRKIVAAAAAAVKTAPPNKLDIKWDTRYKQLVAFKEEHGHCNVSTYLKDHDQDLACWVATQRTNHRFLREGKKSNLTPERIQLLRSIGFDWVVAKTPQLPFDQRLKQLEEYKEKHGHTNVPQKCKDPVGLGNFVLEIRRDYKALERNDPLARKRLTKERIQALEALGFKWRLRIRTGGQKPQQNQREEPHANYNATHRTGVTWL